MKTQVTFLNTEQLRELIRKRPTNFLTPDMIKTLIENVPKLSCYKPKGPGRKPLEVERMQLLIENTYQPALRIDEGISLDITSFDADTGKVLIKHSKTGYEFCECAKKELRPNARRYSLVSCDTSCKMCGGTGKIRLLQKAPTPIWLIKKNMDLAKDWKVKKFFFRTPSFPDQPIGYEWVRNQLIELGEICKFKIHAEYKKRTIDQMYTHIFRKSKAKQMLLDGFNLADIMTQLRHSNIETTSRYLSAGLDDLGNKYQEIYG